MSSQEDLQINLELPPKLMPLMGEAGARFRYYVAHGGRGSAKSWSYARSLLALGVQRPLRILCAREIQKTLADSVHTLLSDQINTMGLGRVYQVTDKAIVTSFGTAFLFSGLRDLDPEKIQSFEGIDICWVEEAQKVTKKSWQILIPTIRKQDSEIWISFNPLLDTDETYQGFVVHPRPNSFIVEMNYRDNPWFGGVLEEERIHDERMMTDEDYQNIWEGVPRSSVPGAIYAKEISQAFRDGRIRPLPYDPRMPVHTIWDLGWNDQTAIIFAQRNLSEVRLIDYEESSYLRPDEWATIIQNKPYHYGDHWLPHDGDNEFLASGGKSMVNILTPLLRKKPKVITRAKSVEDPIRAARMLFPRVYINQDRCERLIECLRRFARNVPQTTNEPGSPMKNEYRHGADAFGGLATIVDQLQNVPEANRKPLEFEAYGQAVRGVI